jgi:hypothetical protein
MSQPVSLGIHEPLAGTRAARYVRMSADYQQYSTENQKSAIADTRPGKASRSCVSMRTKDAVDSWLIDGSL